MIYMRIWWVHIQNGAVYGVGFDAPAGCIIDAHRRLRQCNCVTFHATYALLAMRMHLNAIHEIEEFLFFSGVIIDFVQF